MDARFDPERAKHFLSGAYDQISRNVDIPFDRDVCAPGWFELDVDRIRDRHCLKDRAELVKTIRLFFQHARRSRFTFAMDLRRRALRTISC